jgi:hypothetical protein
MRFSPLNFGWGYLWPELQVNLAEEKGHLAA